MSIGGSSPLLPFARRPSVGPVLHVPPVGRQGFAVGREAPLTVSPVGVRGCPSEGDEADKGGAPLLPGS